MVKVDVDDEWHHRHNVLLLLDAESEKVADEKHLDDVDEVSHPSCVMSGVKPIRHLKLELISGQELK